MIPREENSYADYLSKIFDFDDWGVCQHIFNYFNLKWGPYTCDRFADSKNCKVSYFNSKFFTPQSSGVDAFAFDWHGHNNWLVPPMNLVTRCLIHMKICRARGTLVVPKWKSAVYWPLLVNRFTDNFRSFVVDYIEYKQPMNFFEAGSQENSIFAQRPFRTNVLVLLIDFS